MFGLTEEQEHLRKEVRAFAEREIAPHVKEWDEHSEFPTSVVKKLGPMGLLGIIFPEELGGAGMGYVEYVLAVEDSPGRRLRRHHRSLAQFALHQPHHAGRQR